MTPSSILTPSSISDASGEAAVDFRQPDWRGHARAIDYGWLMGDPFVPHSDICLALGTCKFFGDRISS